MKIQNYIFIILLVAASLLLGQVKINDNINLALAPSFLALFLIKDYRSAIIALISLVALGFLNGTSPYTFNLYIIMVTLVTIMFLVAQLIINKLNAMVGVGFIIIFYSLVISLIIPLTKNFDGYQHMININSGYCAINLIIALLIYPILYRRMNEEPQQ